MPAPTGRSFVLSRRAIIAALSALPFEARSQALSPQAFLQSIYDPYLKADFRGYSFEQANRFFVPFLDAQDWEIKNLAISVKADGPKATGEVAFDNLGKRTQITLDLVQTQAGWRIADIKAPSGSLSDLYKQP